MKEEEGRGMGGADIDMLIETSRDRETGRER
jgi:hypothetical protein